MHESIDRQQSLAETQRPAPATAPRPLPRWFIPSLAMLFLLSGACALVYQTLWLRRLSLIFGVTVYAASTVLASFMTGLAIGSFAAGRLADRTTEPLKLFGIAEILVGLSALATPIALDAALAAYTWLAALTPSLSMLTAMRFVLAFAVLVFPTALMGTTLPLVMKSSLTRDEAFGSRASLLYAVNTAGAIAGALAAGFYLVPFVGLTRAFFIAAGTNMIIGSVALLISRRLPAAHDIERLDPARASTAGHTVSPSTRPLGRGQRRLVLTVFAFSGALSIALEVVWFRVLVVFLRPTTYSFTMMLAAVLGGIALGSALVVPFARRRADWLLLLAGLEMAVGIVALSSFFAFGLAIDLTPALMARLDAFPTIAHLAPLAAASALAIFPTALLLGAAFPIGLRLYHEGASDPVTAAGHVGTFYSLNVCGAILGSLGAGFLLIPRLGSQWTLRLLAGLALASGLALAASHARQRSRAVVALSALAVAAFAWLAVRLVNPFDVSRSRLQRHEVLLWREEGIQTTVAVHQRDSMKIMYLDGHHQANDSPGMSFVHHRIGWLPMALHPQPRRALVIGVGGGATPGAVARFPGVDVEVVELSGSVVHGSDWFRAINFDLLRRPTVYLRVDDGRNFMLLSPPARYDVITADVILPRHAGAGSLYSVEYFQLMRKVLRNDGLVLQWIGANTDVEYRLLMRTFLSVFPHSTLWGDGSLLIGSKRPLTISRSDHEFKLTDPATRAVFEAFTIAPFERLLGQYIAGPQELAAFVGGGDILSDDRPRIEYFLSLPRDDRPVDLTGVAGDVGRHVRD